MDKVTLSRECAQRILQKLDRLVAEWTDDECELHAALSAPSDDGWVRVENKPMNFYPGDEVRYHANYFVGDPQMAYSHYRRPTPRTEEG